MGLKNYRKAFESEAELCSAFMEKARAAGFKTYAETSGFDLLLVATAECCEKFLCFYPGDQIGVQAKLLPNIAVLHQAMPGLGKTGPQYYAVLLPYAPQEFRDLAKRLGIAVFEALTRKRKLSGFIDNPDFGLIVSGFAYKKSQHLEACWIPEVEVSIPAGTRSPKQLTPWKMAAVKLCVLGISKGYLTTRDFAAAKISMARWAQKHWIRPATWIKEGDKRLKSYVLQEDNAPPHVLYPEILEALETEGLI